MSCLADDKCLILTVYCSYLLYCAHLEKGSCTFSQAAPSLSVEVKE